MKATIELTIKIPVTFDILKGQAETKDNPGREDEIIDIDINYINTCYLIDDAIKDNIEDVDAQLWEQLEKAKKEALYDQAVDNFEGEFKI